ncbi:MAG: hypothetical protein EBR79_03140 [Proteobacteria bacterium]|nr:hypothetical protein [Pseudomonadota bacterium]NBX86275.1 hypothetical protein [Pseudomonadota bacterium]
MQKITLPSLFHNQSGAMFGLDARIALAIFGILSVVAGVSAINVFSQAGTTALTTELTNMKKAYTEFHLSTSEHTLKFLDLVNNESEIPGWSGPYVDGMLSDKSRGHGTYSLTEGRQDVPGVPPVECSGGICGIWLKLTKVKDGLARDVDKALDGDDSPNGGTFRIEFIPGAVDDVYYLISTNRNGSMATRSAE